MTQKVDERGTDMTFMEIVSFLPECFKRKGAGMKGANGLLIAYPLLEKGGKTGINWIISQAFLTLVM